MDGIARHDIRSTLEPLQPHRQPRAGRFRVTSRPCERRRHPPSSRAMADCVVPRCRASSACAGFAAARPPLASQGRAIAVPPDPGPFLPPPPLPAVVDGPCLSHRREEESDRKRGGTQARRPVRSFPVTAAGRRRPWCPASRGLIDVTPGAILRGMVEGAREVGVAHVQDQALRAFRPSREDRGRSAVRCGGARLEGLGRRGLWRRRHQAAHRPAGTGPVRRVPHDRGVPPWGVCVLRPRCCISVYFVLVVPHFSGTIRPGNRIYSRHCMRAFSSQVVASPAFWDRHRRPEHGRNARNFSIRCTAESESCR